MAAYIPKSVGFIVVLVFLWSVQATAGVYKWTDAKGKVHFGDKPPMSSESEKLEIDTQDKGIYQPSGDYKQRQEKLLKVFKEKRKTEEKLQQSSVVSKTP